MTGEQFRTTLNARPFVPFTIRTADGERCPVSDPNVAWAPPTGRLAFLALDDGSARIIDIRLVTAIEFSAEDAAEKLLE
jgi:hypothetical protein